MKLNYQNILKTSYTKIVDISDNVKKKIFSKVNC